MTYRVVEWGRAGDGFCAAYSLLTSVFLMVAWGPFWVSPRYCCCFLFSTHVFVMDLSITFQYSWVIATVSFCHHQVAPSLGYSKFSDFNSTRISRCLHKFNFTALPCASSHLNMLCNMKILFYMLYNMFPFLPFSYLWFQKYSRRSDLQM